MRAYLYALLMDLIIEFGVYKWDVTECMGEFDFIE